MDVFEHEELQNRISDLEGELAQMRKALRALVADPNNPVSAAAEARVVLDSR